jgi:hypothetical protein
MAQAQDDQWRSDAAAFKPSIANASGHTSHQFDQPFLLTVVDIQYCLHDGRSTMAHAQHVVQAAGSVCWFHFRAQVVLHMILLSSFHWKKFFPNWQARSVGHILFIS